MHALAETVNDPIRRTSRFNFGVPVTFSFGTNEGVVTCEGVTKDISSDGVFIWSSIPPPEHCEVDCRIYLGDPGSGFPRYRIQVRGKIHRVEQPPAEHSMYGFAVLSDSIRIFIGDERSFEKNDG